MATLTGERYDIGGDVLFVSVHHLPELDQDDDVIPQLRALLRWVDDGTTGQSTKLENYSITVAYRVWFTDKTIIGIAYWSGSYCDSLLKRVLQDFLF